MPARKTIDTSSARSRAPTFVIARTACALAARPRHDGSNRTAHGAGVGRSLPQPEKAAAALVRTGWARVEGLSDRDSVGIMTVCSAEGNSMSY